MSILFLMVASALCLTVQEAIEGFIARRRYRSFKFNRPRQYKFN